MRTHCVLCQIWTEFLHIIQTGCSLQLGCSSFPSKALVQSRNSTRTIYGGQSALRRVFIRVRRASPVTMLHTHSPIYRWWYIQAEASACKTTTTQNQTHQISNTQRTENKTTDVVIQQRSRRLLKMDILMSETCWAHKKWNKIASDIKLVFHSSSITMMHGPINIK